MSRTARTKLTTSRHRCKHTKLSRRSVSQSVSGHRRWSV